MGDNVFSIHLINRYDHLVQLRVPLRLGAKPPLVSYANIKGSISVALIAIQYHFKIHMMMR